jgi:hypothetical protein
MGGPILDTPEVLLVVKVATAVEAEQRLALDPWTLSGHLHISRIQSGSCAWESSYSELAVPHGRRLPWSGNALRIAASSAAMRAQRPATVHS